MRTTPIYHAIETPLIFLAHVRRTSTRALVETLLPGEHIFYEIFNSAGASVATGSDASEITYQGNGTWAAQVGPFPVGHYRVKWTVNVGGGVAEDDDHFRVVA